MKSDQEGNIIISRVLVGGAADKCGMLAAGDTIHSVNGEDIHGLSVDDVAKLMVSSLYVYTLYVHLI